MKNAFDTIDEWAQTAKSRTRLVALFLVLLLPVVVIWRVILDIGQSLIEMCPSLWDRLRFTGRESYLLATRFFTALVKGE